MQTHSEEIRGYLYAVLAFGFWGLIPIYFKLLSHVGAGEVLAHRIIGSVVLLYAMILFSKQMGQFKLLIRDLSKLKYLVLSALLVSLNWLVFIWAVSHNMIAESSLGYYINPLVNFALGIIVFKDRPSFWQKIAIALAIAAIVYQLVTLGTLPIVSLVLAFSFAFYGLIRKKVNLPAMTGLYVETLILFPIALLYFVYLVLTDQNAFVLPLDRTSWILLLAGVVTVVPLLWFNAATTRISLIHIGFFQYIGPSISFLLAIFVYDEVLLPEKLTTFVLIWIALAIFSLDAYFKKRR
ncbi:MAG: EamA family transporter RarD [Epsilonproteobacteria bacterium]|uniref:Protein RarD n=1 Tax=Sulfurospirillum cavolei TaxID=366522 RepID=A0A2D3WHL8_9BACT|nr:EamA family transporter RarD [Sulfurospirillum cavolei]MDY0263960.1 EamA family transporter RarD [Sulfurospirillum cavolei]NCB54430.1 EamA family transporter RarD [Campylobacterota bacterium]DAB37214.1 MAG TPA: protein RarD [Sulfurospirillum cavolei]